MDQVPSESDQRTLNNTDAVRHNYRELTETEKQSIVLVKDIGKIFLDTIDKLGDSRELDIARERVEEAVMWAVKHITA